MLYTKEDLKKIPYFTEIGEDAFDNLTGVVSRNYMIKYIEGLIKDNIDFSFAILDIDNFKLFNDNYGHQLGDLVLMQAAKNLLDEMGAHDLVGRYGGDEFLIVSVGKNDYDSTWAFYKNIMANGLRREILVGEDEQRLLITATIGISRYSIDGKNYEELFAKADKALYRGKMKGRNCFIIYLDEKHKDIDTTKALRKAVNTNMQVAFDTFCTDKPIKKRIADLIKFVCNTLTITAGALFIEGERFAEWHKNKLELQPPTTSDIDNNLNEEEMLIVNDRSPLKQTCYELHKYCYLQDIKSMVAIRGKFNKEILGYFVFADSNIKRIWQGDDKALLLYAAHLITITLNDLKEE